MNQNHFTPLYCEECQSDYADWQQELRAWRKANAGRGKHWSYGKPVQPKGCHVVIEAPCCGEGYQCGEKHGHPTDEEEARNKRHWDQLLWGPPNDHLGRGTVFRGYPVDPCVLCDGVASEWVGNNKPVCRSCFDEMKPS
jgi:hypothetical protein